MKKNLTKKSRIKRFCNCFKNDDTKCQARAMWGSSCCFFHSPLTQEARKAAQQRGGRANGPRVLPKHAGDLSLRSERTSHFWLNRPSTSFSRARSIPSPQVSLAIWPPRSSGFASQQTSRSGSAGWSGRVVYGFRRDLFDLDRDLGAISSDEWKWENPGCF